MHRGRHRAVRPDQVGRALKRALLATLVPGLVIALVGWVVLKVASRRLLDVAVDPYQFKVLAVGVCVLWAVWIAFILRTYLSNRGKVVSTAFQLGGGIGVLLMCSAVAAPLVVVAPRAAAHLDALVSVFNEESATTPDDVTAANPWGDRRRVNVLLLGGDGSVHRPGVRTDSMILASLDTKTGRTILFSLPRNLQDVPFKPGSKLAELYPNGFTNGTPDNAEFFLNAVYRNVPAVHPGVLGRSSNEGADAIKLAVAGALGIRVDYYVLVNLSGFSKIVDAMGGITVNINEPVPIGGNTDAGIAPDSYLQPGPNQKLDGFEALWFTRGRYGSTDYKRMERQRCAINAIIDEADPLSLFRHYQELARTAKRIVRTDIPRKLLPSFVDLANLVKGKQIKSVGFERSEAFDPNDPDFAYMHEAVQKALYPKRYATGTPTNVQADKSPTKASNTKDDCAYDPRTTTEG